MTVSSSPKQTGWSESGTCGWIEEAIELILRKATPVLVLGSGASISTCRSLNVSPGFPSMADLAKRYRDQIDTSGLDATDAAAHAALSRALDALGDDLWKFNLEEFLADHPLRLDHALLSAITAQTFEALVAPHRALRAKFEASPSVTFPFRRLLKALLTARGDSRITVVTPNYDLIVEHTADLLGYPCLTGFSGSFLRRWNGATAFKAPEVRSGSKWRQTPHVRLLKPHGSAAWFRSGDGASVVESFGAERPSGDWQSCIVTPGLTKYAQTLKDVTREHLHASDRALREAKSLLVIGYGFADPHLQVKLVEALSRGRPALILTRDLSAKAMAEFVEPYSNVFCLTDDGNGGTRVQRGSQQLQSPYPDLWTMDRFVDRFLPA